MIFKEMKCRSCGKVFEALIRAGEPARCPACGSEEVETNLSGGRCNRPGKGGCSGNCKTCGGCH